MKRASGLAPVAREPAGAPIRVALPRQITGTQFALSVVQHGVSAALGTAIRLAVLLQALIFSGASFVGQTRVGKAVAAFVCSFVIFKLRTWVLHMRRGASASITSSLSLLWGFVRYGAPHMAWIKADSCAMLPCITMQPFGLGPVLRRINTQVQVHVGRPTFSSQEPPPSAPTPARAPVQVHNSHAVCLGTNSCWLHGHSCACHRRLRPALQRPCADHLVCTWCPALFANIPVVV